MTNFSKWIGGALGWSFGGPIGGILGFVLGSLIDGFSTADIETVRRESSGADTTRDGDFEISLLVLAAVVIKADGRVNKTELDYVRSAFVQMYGKERANNAFKLFNGIMKKNISTRQVCMQIRQNMAHASRLQLLHFLFSIAKADGVVTNTEHQAIARIAGYLYINQRDFESIRAMFYTDTFDAYTILEIDKSATNDEVKAAYRKMAKKHHPDKLRHLGEEHLKGAEEKFRQIQKAYEQIQKERGI